VKLSQLHACDVPLMIPDAVISVQGARGMIEEVIASHRSDSPFLLKISWRSGATSFPLFPFECDGISVDMSACSILCPNLSNESPLVRFMNYREVFNVAAMAGAADIADLLGSPRLDLHQRRQLFRLTDDVSLVFEAVRGTWRLVTLELDDNSTNLWDTDICSVHSGLEECPKRRAQGFDALLKLKSWGPMATALAML